MLCKDYVITEQKSISDGFTEGFINLGKSRNIIVFKCIKRVLNLESQKYNYISETIILFLIIEIILSFNCERGIKIYIKNLIYFSLNRPEENNDDSLLLINDNNNENDNLFQLIISIFKKISELFLFYFKKNN